jgi:Na+-exporting ATPase
MAGQFDRHPFLLAPSDVAASLKTDVDKGLSSAQVAQLQQEYPRNELDVGGAIPWYTIFIKQLFNAMILVCFIILPHPG